jgi:pimeloyl-ACP methyl ester carboxylesterase
MPTHADDVVAAMDALEVERAVLVGHSMGAFVSLVLADRHPERVTSLVLVDGGMPLLPPEGVTPDQLAQAVLGPAAARLQMEFPDRGAYQQFFRNHPAFVDAWSDLVTAYVDYDLVGEEPHLRPATSVEALQEDIRELVDGQSLLRALANLRHEAAWLVAPRGLVNEVPPLYPDAAREHWLTQHPQLELAEVPDVNHYTVVMHEAGMHAVAPWVERALGR